MNRKYKVYKKENGKAKMTSVELAFYPEGVCG